MPCDAVIHVAAQRFTMQAMRTVAGSTCMVTCRSLASPKRQPNVAAMETMALDAPPAKALIERRIVSRKTKVSIADVSLSAGPCAQPAKRVLDTANVRLLKTMTGRFVFWA